MQAPSSGTEVVKVKNKFLETNMVYRIVALFLAISLWVGISVSGNPVEQKIVSVPLEYENLPAGQMIVSQEDTVSVRLEGRVEDLEFIYAQDIEALVDLTLAKTGNNQTAVEVRVPSSVSLVEVKPSQAQVVIDDIRQVQLPVKVSVSGYPKEGYKALEPILSPAEVLVEAPENTLEEMADLSVNVILDYESSYKKNLPVLVTDQEGKDMTDKVRLSPAVVEVSLPIFPQDNLLEKPVHVPLVGTPPPGYEVVGLQATPDRVQVSGEYKAFQNIIYYASQAIDLSGRTETFTVQVPIINENEYVQIRPQTIEVIVQMEKVD